MREEHPTAIDSRQPVEHMQEEPGSVHRPTRDNSPTTNRTCSAANIVATVQKAASTTPQGGKWGLESHAKALKSCMLM